MNTFADSMGVDDRRANSAVQVVPAGFWIRFVAVVIDAVILNLVEQPISLGINFIMSGSIRGQTVAALILGTLINLCITIFYFGYFYTSYGATPGKLAFGMKVLTNDTGEYLSFGRVISRELGGKFLCGLTLGVGFIIAGVRSDKRGLHDLVAKTCVVRTRRS